MASGSIQEESERAKQNKQHTKWFFRKARKEEKKNFFFQRANTSLMCASTMPGQGVNFNIRVRECLPFHSGEYERIWWQKNKIK
jgi:hypothetical protein